MYARVLPALSAAALAIGLLAPSAHAQAYPSFGDLIKLPNDGNPETTYDTSVYYYAADGKRYVFATEKTYKTWYQGFSNIKTVSAATLGDIPIGGNVTYRPGARLVKIDTDPKVYAVSKNGILRALASESVAAALYGANWNTQQVDDIPDGLFVNYKVGSPITVASDYERAVITASSPTISVDKLVAAPPQGFVDVRSGSGFTSNQVTVPRGTAVTWVSLDDSMPTVASDPHPAHTDMPSFQTTTLKMGQSWSFTFHTAGTFNFHNHNSPNHTGKVIVTQ